MYVCLCVCVYMSVGACVCIMCWDWEEQFPYLVREVKHELSSEDPLGPYKG